MALTRVNGDMIYGASLLSGTPVSFNSPTAIAASTTRLHVLGRFWNADRSSKNITKIYWRFGAVTINSASVLRVSIQAVSLTSGPPGRGDGSVIQSGTVAGSNGSFTSNTWFPGLSLGASYTANYGDLFAIVFELTTFNVSDSVVISSINPASAAVYPSGSANFLVSEVGGVFTISATVPNILFECDDGTFATFSGTFPLSTLNAQTYNSGSTPDEYCLEFSMSIPTTLCGVLVYVNIGANADFSVILYSGTTALQTVSVDANTAGTTGTARWYYVEFPETDLTASTTYRISVRPDTTISVLLSFMDVPSASYFGAHPLESNFCINSRTGTGAWGSATTTRRPYILPKFSKMDNGAGGSGGMIQTRVQTGM